MQIFNVNNQPKEYTGVDNGKYYLIQTVPQFKDLINKASEQKYLAVDTESSSLSWVFGDACGISIGWGVNNNYYLPFNHKKSIGEYDGLTDEKQLEKSIVVELLNQLFSRADCTYFMANAKHDLHVLLKEGISVHGVVHDIVILSNMVDENGDHGVKDLSVQIIDKDAAKWEKDLKAWRLEESKRRRAYVTVRSNEIVNELKKDENLVAALRLKVEAEGFTEKRAITSAIKRYLKAQALEQIKDKYYVLKNKIADISYDYVPLDIIAPYACSDVHYTWELGWKFLDIVSKDSDLKGIYVNELKLAKVLTHTEWDGVKIDRQYLIDIGPELDRRIAEAQKEVYSEVGYEFNISSPKQILEVLYDKGIKLTKLTKGSENKLRKGEIEKSQVNYAADSDVLDVLAREHLFAKKIVDYRETAKLKSTYRDNLLKYIDYENVYRPNFNQNVVTGRMSSSGGVNMQNIPAGDTLIRRAFMVPSEDFVFVFIDYSQIELRILAHLSQDPNLLACYPWRGQGVDVHSLTAAEAVMGISVEDYLAIMEDEMHPRHADAIFARAIAKRVNFGISYGANKYTIQEQVSTPDRYVSAEICQGYIDGFFNKYKFVKKMIANTNKTLHANGYVQHELGRYRRFPEIPELAQEMNEIRYRTDHRSKARKKELFPKLARAERQANNFMIQGLAADVFKTSVVRVDEVLKGTKSRICNFVHDELQFYIHKSEFGVLKDIKRVMEDYEFSVPLKVEISYSNYSWAEKKKVKLSN